MRLKTNLPREHHQRVVPRCHQPTNPVAKSNQGNQSMITRRWTVGLPHPPSPFLTRAVRVSWSSDCGWVERCWRGWSILGSCRTIRRNSATCRSTCRRASSGPACTRRPNRSTRWSPVLPCVPPSSRRDCNSGQTHQIFIPLTMNIIT